MVTMAWTKPSSLVVVLAGMIVSEGSPVKVTGTPNMGRPVGSRTRAMSGRAVAPGARLICVALYWMNAVGLVSGGTIANCKIPGPSAALAWLLTVLVVRTTR